MNKVAIVDYGVGNLDSVARAVEECGGDPLIASKPSGLEQARRIVLPGVGSFADGMRQLQARELEGALQNLVIEKGVPFLGICLGMQLLAKKGTEGGETPGLGWIDGEVKRMEPNGHGERIPHIGWNDVDFDSRCPLFAGIPPQANFYFVHSYHFVCPEANIVGRTPYCGSFASVVARDSIFGVQFHPEKSQRFGFKILKNFLNL